MNDLQRRTFDRNGMQIEEIILKQENGYTVGWCNESMSKMTVGDKRNPIVHVRVPDRENATLEIARESISKKFDEYWV